MPLETASFITDLVTANPAHTDGLSQADSHARLIKSTIKATFPNFTSTALQSTQAQLDAAASQGAGTATSVIPLGTALLPGLTPIGDPNTGLWSPAADQLAVSLAGLQVLLMGGTAIVTSLGFAAAAIATTGAYSGGTGQLVPIGATLLWWDDALPAEGGYAWANGQIIANANTVCPILLARWGSKFGGNGITTMGVPNLQEVAPVGKSGMGGATSPGLLASISAGLKGVLGAIFGSDTYTMLRSDMPNVVPVFTGAPGTVNVNSVSGTIVINGSAIGLAGGGSSVVVGTGVASIGSTGNFTPSGAVQALNGGVTQTTMPLVQPSRAVNYIIRLG